MNTIDKVNITNNKILFLGYGAVAKCVWNYFDNYFNYDIKNIYIIDKSKEALYGPKLDIINKNNIFIETVKSDNFDFIINKLNIKQNDIIIDLTFLSNTYYFINKCLLFGINYINTSIEDSNDEMLGSSIYIQQKTLAKIYTDFKKNNIVKSNILTEFGQNPGLIQHYILFALNHLNKLYYKNDIDDYKIKSLTKAIDNYEIGIILSSEIDNLTTFNEKNSLDKHNKIFNTWSVSGLLGEGADKTELVYGKKNKFIKPAIPNSVIDFYKSSIISSQNKDCNILFLHETGMNCSLNSICPVLDKNSNIKFVPFDGKLIHHGEVFELSKLFGNKAPFMSYVYKFNKYVEKSIKKFIKNNNIKDDTDLELHINHNNNNFHVFDNINKHENDKLIGHDSIGCTIFCGTTKIKKIFWCGSILSNTDPNIDSNFTPTIIQVAAGVLTGLSFIMEKSNKNIGLINPCDIDTKYVFKKALPLLGKFFFTEIPVNLFDKKFKFKINKII